MGIGIFAILMAMVSAFMAVGLRSLRTASTANSLQAQQQVAVIEMSKQIKFIDNPCGARLRAARHLEGHGK